MSGSSRCRACGRPIVWATSQREKNIPWDPDPNERGTHVLVSDVHNGAVHFTSRLPRRVDGDSPRLHTCHFTTCSAKQRRTKE